jgi:hypothetical protein
MRLLGGQLALDGATGRGYVCHVALRVGQEGRSLLRRTNI